MAQQVITMLAKLFYDEIYLQNEKQLYNLLFPIEDTSTAASFQLDDYIQEVHAAAYRIRDTDGQMVEYQAGSTTEITVPQGSTLTAITEELIDAITVGLNPNTPIDEQYRAKLQKIVQKFVAMWNMTHNKQSITLFETGIFSAPGENGEEIGLELAFGRAAGNNIIYDATAVGATFSEAIIFCQTTMIDDGLPRGQQFAFLGNEWESFYREDPDVIAWLKEKPVIPEFPEALKGYEGVDSYEYLKLPGMKDGIWLLFYAPGLPYTPKKGAASEPWITPENMIMGSFLDPRYDINRGVNVVDRAGTDLEIVAGRINFDYFVDFRNKTRYARANVRKALMAANIDRTYVCNGTF